MNSKYILGILSILILLLFSECTKDNSSSDTKEEIEDNLSVYVSEAEQGDYKNIYSYERVDGKIRIKQIDLFKFGIKKYDLRYKYDEQNRLIQCKRSVIITDNRYHENVILNDFLPSDYSIQYGSNKLTVTDNDDISNTRTYNLGSDGFAKEISWTYEGESQLMSLKRSGNNLISIDHAIGSGNSSSDKKYSFVYDDQNSVDYLRMTLPSLYSSNNILRTVITVDGVETNRVSYAYEYTSANYPFVIMKNETIINGNQEELVKTSTTLKYINTDNI